MKSFNKRRLYIMNDIDVGDSVRLSLTTWPFKGVYVTIFSISNLSLTQTVLKIRHQHLLPYSTDMVTHIVYDVCPKLYIMKTILGTSRLEQYRWRMLETIDVGYMFAMIPQPTTWNGHHHEVTWWLSPTSLWPTFLQHRVSDGDKYLMLVLESLFW